MGIFDSFKPKTNSVKGNEGSSVTVSTTLADTFQLRNRIAEVSGENINIGDKRVDDMTDTELQEEYAYLGRAQNNSSNAWNPKTHGQRLRQITNALKSRGVI